MLPGDRTEGIAAARRVLQCSFGPAYFAHIYSNSKKGADYALSYLQPHGLEDCCAVQEMTTILELPQANALRPGRSFINWSSSEHMLRRCYGLELAFAKCRGEHDWNRGASAPKPWKSKVDWDACKRMDPRSL